MGRLYYLIFIWVSNRGLKIMCYKKGLMSPGPEPSAILVKNAGFEMGLPGFVSQLH